MRVTLVGPSLNQRGGIVSVTKEIRDYLVTKGVTVQIIGTTTGQHGWRGKITFIQAWISIISTCLLRKTDLVHLNMASRGSCLRKSIICLTCWLFRTPYVIHLHGGGFQNFHENEIGYFGRCLVNFLFSRAACVIALSLAWETWLKSAIKLKNVTTVFNGVPNFDLDTSKQKKPTILFLGLLGSNKGTDVLINAMREVNRQIPQAVLELGGDGDIDTYRQQAADLPNVRFLGWVDNEGRKAALSRSTIYCLPSWKEGLPMSILEAMSAALPVVSTPVGGIPEAVKEGVTGLLVQPGDVHGLANALCQLLLDPSKAKSMGLKGQALQRSKFSADAMGSACLKIYESCTIKNPTRNS